MNQVKDEKISNEKLRKIFYNIPDARGLIAVETVKFHRENCEKGRIFLSQTITHSLGQRVI